MANISTLGQALDQIERLKTQQSRLDLLTNQIATGKKTQSFSGLGTDVLSSQRARADIRSLEVYSTNITNSLRRTDLMIRSIEDIQAQADNVINALTVPVQEGEYPELGAIQELATNVYNFIIDAMNIQDEDRYLFAGSDTQTKPISDTGLFDSFLGSFLPDETDLTNPPLVSSGLVGKWGDGTITTDEFISSYRSVNETVIGYSSSLSNDTTGRVFARVSETQEFDYTFLADEEGFTNILISLKVLQELPPPEYAPGALNDPTATTLPDDTLPSPPDEKQENFYQVLNDLSNLLTTAVSDLDDVSYRLALVQTQMNRVQESHTEDIDMLASIVSDVEDIDLNEAAVQISQLQITLEASYRVTALVSQLSLGNFLR